MIETSYMIWNIKEFHIVDQDYLNTLDKRSWYIREGDPDNPGEWINKPPAPLDSPSICPLTSCEGSHPLCVLRNKETGDYKLIYNIFDMRRQ
jgi:hypothetical protein